MAKTKKWKGDGKFVGELIKYQSSDNLELSGFLVTPKKKPLKKICVVHIHGLTGDFTSRLAQIISKPVNELGISLFSIDTRGKGMISSFKTRVKGVKKYNLGGTSYEKFEDCVKDIDGAIKFLKKRGYEKFILSGHSTGCQKTSYYLQKNKKNVIGLMLYGCVDDRIYEKKHNKNFKKEFNKSKSMVKAGKGKEIRTQDFGKSFMTYKRYYELMNERGNESSMFNYDKRLKKIKNIKQPILSVIGESEEYTVYDVVDMLNAIQREAKNPLSMPEIIPGNHSFYGGEYELQKVTKKWLKTILN